MTRLFVPLFNPRKEEWDEHFSPALSALIPTGVAHTRIDARWASHRQVLGLNEEMRQMIRYEHWTEGRYPVANGRP